MSYDLINCCLVSCIRLNFIYIYIYLLEPVHLSDTVGSFFSYHLYTWITFYYRILLPPGGSFESSLTVPVVIVLLFFEALERHCTLFLQLVISEIHTVHLLPLHSLYFPTTSGGMTLSGSVSDQYSLNPNPAKNLNLDPDQEDPWIRIRNQAVS